jgi:uncharacterized protein
MFDADFLKGDTWGFHGSPVEHVETHAAHVFLVGNRAFKIKKSIKLPYLDFSTRERRRAVLENELRINRAFAPNLYLQVAEVLGEPVLVMRRFAANALLSWKIEHGGISTALAADLAAMVASAHSNAERRDMAGAGIMMKLGAQLSKAFTDSTDLFQPSVTLEFHALYEAALSRYKPLLNRRGEQGLVCLCHGDMHSGNIIVENGKPLLFDAIEFSETIATIDVLYDLAFLLMDLWSNDQRAAANLILNRYLNLRRRQEDLSGLSLLPLFLSTRAGVRALVTADLVHELPVSQSMKLRGEVLDWFRDSIAYLKPSRPVLVTIGGLSGTGKSTLAEGLAQFLGAAPGAIHVRSDIERKVLAGVAETEKLPDEFYSHASSAETYSACFERAKAALQTGHSVVLDAVFADVGERRAAESLAAIAGVSFHGIWLEAPPETMKARVAARKNDASDATSEVVETQLSYSLGTVDWSHVDASGSPQQTLELVRQTLQSRRGGLA